MTVRRKLKNAYIAVHDPTKALATVLFSRKDAWF